MIIIFLIFIILSAPLLIIPLTWWSIEAGIFSIIILFPTYLLRNGFFGIPTTILELSIYGMSIGAILHWLLRGGWRWPKLPRWYHVLGAAWILAWVLATVFSTDRQASLGAFKAWLIDPMLFGAVLLVAVQTVRQRALVLKAVALSGTFVAIAGLVQLVAFRDTLQDGRLSSFFHPVANYAAMYLGPLIVFITGAILWKLLSRRWWFTVILMTVALALTVSFGGYVAIGVGAIVLWWRWPDRRQRSIALGLGLGVGLLGLLAISQTSYLAEKFNTTDRSSSLVRTQIWRTSVEMIKDHPLFGVGPNAYEAVYRQTVPKLYWPPLEWLVSQPHQLYLALWLETGLLGLLVFMTFVIYWIRWLWPRVQRRDGPAVMSLAALLAILVHGFVDTPLFKNDLVLIILLVLVFPLLNVGEEEK